MALKLQNDFKEFLKSLNANNVQYLLIGGYAVSYHGYPRATNDIDFWIAVNPENAARAVAALREFGFGTSELSESLFLKDKSIVRMGMPPMRIEVTTGISGVSFGECFAERIIDKIDDIDVNIISLRHLKVNKKAAGRFKDLNDLENLP